MKILFVYILKKLTKAFNKNLILFFINNNSNFLKLTFFY